MRDDLRKQRSDSSEGRSIARRVWERYAAAANSIRPRWWDDAFSRLTGQWSVDIVVYSCF